MKPAIKLALAFLGGAGAGSGVTCLVMKKLAKLEVIVPLPYIIKKENRSSDYKETIMKLETEIKAMQDMHAADEKHMEDLNRTIDKYEKEVYEYLTNPNRYSTAAHTDIPPEEKAREDETIYEITLEDFMSDSLFDKGYLTYYRGDGVLSTESDEMVEDPAYALGESGKNLALYDSDTIYIRNTRVGCDYQVDFVSWSYSEEVLGNED